MNIFIPLFLLLSFFSLAEDVPDSTIPFENLFQDEARNCSFSTQILQFPFTITTPGLYCVGNNVSAAFSQQQPAITINVSVANGSGNVILDLNNQTIRNPGSRLTQIGILVQGQTNVVIRNGTLLNFINGITINSTQTRSQTILIEKVTLIQNSIGINVFGAAGTIGAIFKNVTAYRSFINGFNINTSTNCIFQNCTASGNGLTNTPGSGFLIINSVLPTFINCQAIGNLMHGFFLQTTQLAQFINCLAAQNTNNGFFITPASANTTVIVGNNIGNSFIGCSAENNQMNGFAIQGIGQSISNCSAISNLLNGFILLTGSDHSILSSLAKLNTVAGINIATGVTECQIRKNTLIGNGTGLLNNGTNNSIYQNFATNNTTNFVGITNFAVSPIITAPINFTANIAQ